MKPSAFLFGINGLDAQPLGCLLHFDLYFVGKRLRLVVRTGLRANCGGNLHLAPGFPVDAHFSKFVLDVDGLPRAERHALLKIP